MSKAQFPKPHNHNPMGTPDGAHSGAQQGTAKGDDVTSITPKQKRLLDFIRSHTEKKGYAPSQMEIAKRFGFSSLGTVQNYLVRLQRAGLLQKTWNAKRDLRAVEAPRALSNPNQVYPSHNHAMPAVLELPLLGRVAAGSPIEAVVNDEVIEVPASMIKQDGREHFVLKVKGDSMIDDGIFDGDFVVIRKQVTAVNGETIVALVDNEATIKRYKRRGDGVVELLPANPKYEPIIVNPDQDLRISGKLVGLIRKGIV